MFFLTSLPASLRGELKIETRRFLVFQKLDGEVISFVFFTSCRLLVEEEGSGSTVRRICKLEVEDDFKKAVLTAECF